VIVVTAPTGNIGHQVLSHVLDSGESVRVIARDPSHLAREARERAEIVQGSHGNAAVVARAFAGADAVFWLWRADELRHRYPRRLSSSRSLYRAHPQGHQAGRPACSLVDQVRARDQPQHCTRARAGHLAHAARDRRRGD
jgi:uncharacterized protein YbjT (DUF2867 family)